MHQKYRQVVFSLSRNKVLNVGLFDMICAVRIALETRRARELKGFRRLAADQNASPTHVEAPEVRE